MNKETQQDARSEQSTTYRSYLLRLWKMGMHSSEWRAVLENPHTGERLGFANLESLFVFLMEQIDGSEKYSR